MENLRSNSTREGKMRMESYYAPTTMKDLRSFSTSRAHYDASPSPSPPPYKELKLKNGKAGRGPSGFASKSWSLNESELQRKKRVAGYKAYSVEGKMKGSFRKSVKWIKNSCNHVVYGWW
nr:Spermatogenesis associated 6-like protein [Ipomoea batatas]GMD30494.1 Spermatogenesis associated 6-like protein [Ipomoea batatas]GMD35465.1 Spermatogenesis associated 6-like protein [Ipomoea batatas]GMD37205.1 Spermatogenesis associated 6-like protein [Ipomoea batatas]